MPSNTDQNKQSLLRQIPSVDQILSSPPGQQLIDDYGHSLTVGGIRQILEKTRIEISSGELTQVNLQSIVVESGAWLKRVVNPSPHNVINATGVIIHTNLGRAPLGHKSIRRMMEVARGYSDLEYDLPAGERGTRTGHAAELINKVTGSEASLIVNNNAAAVLLMLTALCSHKEVIISRGQLVEIGGGFRIPEVMAQSGAALVEVGTTNRTHLHDYVRAINHNTVAIMVAHHSNYKIVGFAGEPNLADLAQVAREHQILLIYDQGSGSLIDSTRFGLDHEPTISDALGDGVDLVSFSGDKLVGGPQAGIICGRSELIEFLSKHPLARAVRADKLCLAALSETVIAYLLDRADVDVPVWEMIGRDLELIMNSANYLAEAFNTMNLDAEVLRGESAIGGGSLPGTTIPTWLAAISVSDVDSFSDSLRTGDPPIISRIVDGKVIFDPRTLQVDELEKVVGAVRKLTT